MVQVNLNSPILDRNGDPMTIDKQAATVGEMCCQALDVVFQKDQGESFGQKMKRWELMVRIQEATAKDGLIELSAAEVSSLQERVAMGGLNTTIVARIGEALEGKPYR